MGTLADDIRSIKDDGRYKPDTKIKKIAERLNLSDVAADAFREAVKNITAQIIERLKERQDEDERPDPEDNLETAALDLITRRSKNWIRDQGDLEALISMMYKTDFFEELNASKRFLKDLEKDLKRIREEAQEDQQDA